MFILDPEMMKKTFLMGENGTNFTHKSAQHIKLFPFTANNTATIITSFSAVIGEWLRLACNQNKVPESMEATLSKLTDSMDDIGAYEKEQLLQIARSIYWDDDEKHSLRPKSITAMCYIPCDDQTALKTAQYLYSVLADNAFNLNTSDPGKKIVIIGGKNGAGKTTLFVAVELALYGHYCFGYKNSGKRYTKKIMTYINDQAKMDEDENAYVAIEFSDSTNGDLDQYRIVRSWSWKKGEPKEDFQVVKNGHHLADQDLADFQTFLLHLIPPALLKLCFFDGERIAEYLLDDQKNNVRDALMVLSGNDTFDIMYSNVRKVLTSSSSEEDDITREYLQSKSTLKRLRQTRDRLAGEIAELQAQQDEKSADIERLKKEYSDQGGISLDEWKTLNTQLKEEEERRERINWERKATAAEILPFIIVGPLLDQVRPQIAKEHEFKTWKAISESIQTDRFKNAVVSSVDKAGAPDSERLGSILYNDIIKFLLPANGWADFVPLFGLSDDDEMRVQAVLNRVSQFEIKKIAGYRKRLDKSLKKSQEIREKLQNSSVENYQEYTDAISKITKEIYDLSLQSQSKQTELTACEEDIIVAEKELETAYKKLEMDIKRRSVSAISSKVLLLLEDLQVIIFDRLIREVREDTLTEFYRLIRKRKFIDDIQIDNEFRVHLLRKQIVEKKDLIKICRRSGIAGIQRSLRKYAFSQLSELIGNPDERNFGKELESCHLNEFELMMEIDKDTLSKGETQVFVMSLYWAMMQQCKCELPFIIDTPFARIDTDHRANIVEQFFKRLPGQLFVLSTNEEISSKHMLALHDQTSNIFLLEYGDDKCTHIMNNQYFEV